MIKIFSGILCGFLLCIFMQESLDRFKLTVYEQIIKDNMSLCQGTHLLALRYKTRKDKDGSLWVDYRGLPEYILKRGLYSEYCMDGIELWKETNRVGEMGFTLTDREYRTRKYNQRIKR